jgi:hypothetical protein
MENNMGSHRMKKEVHFEETYSPMAIWESIRLLLILKTVNKWNSKQIHICNGLHSGRLELLPGINFPNINKKAHCLQILKYISMGKGSGKIWFEHLKIILTYDLQHSQSKYDECILIIGTTIFFVYTHDDIVLYLKHNKIKQIIMELLTPFDVKYKGNI